MHAKLPHFASWLALAVVAWAACAQSSPSHQTAVPTANAPNAPDGKGDHTMSSRASLRLLHASGVVQAGDRTTLAVHFDIDDGWHMYWNGIAEEGMEPRWTLDLPAGWEVAGEVRWPVPHRNAANEFAIEHIFERTLSLLVPVQVPANARLGTVRIGVEAKWIICKDVCLSEQESSSVELRVVEHVAGAADNINAPPADSLLPRHIIARAERAAAIPSINSPRAEELALRATLANRQLHISLPDQPPANADPIQGLAFFPAQGTSAIEEDAEAWTTTDRELTFTLSTESNNPVKKGGNLNARGIVEVRTLKAGVPTREYFWLELPAPVAAQPVPRRASPTSDGK